MASCRVVRKNLTAWVDQELSPRWEQRVSSHLASCATCAAEAGRVRAAIERHRTVLPRAVAAGGIELGALRARLQRALAAEEQQAEPLWRWRLRPLAFAGAAALAVALALVLFAGGPNAVLIPLGVQSPPPAVRHAPELFKEYQLIKDLDALENFDTVESVPLDDEQATQPG